MGQVNQIPFNAEDFDNKKQYLYNALRGCLAERGTSSDDMHVIAVGPIQMAIKSELNPDAVGIAYGILDHPMLLDGIQTKDLLTSYEGNKDWEPFYHPMLAVIATAIGIKEQFLKYNTIVDKIYPNLENDETKQYLEELHNKSL